MNAPTPERLAAVEAQNRHFSRGMSGAFARDIFVSGVLPWISVYVLEHFGVSLVRALAISTVFPFGDGIFSLVKRHRINAIGAINLGFLLGSIAFTFLTGDIHILLLKGAVLTGIFSLLCLGSLLARRPLMFYLGRQLSTRDDPKLEAEWDAQWEQPRFRSIIRLITAAWGVGYMLEVIARVITAYTLPPQTVFATAPFITYGVLVILMTWTITYSAAMRRKYAAFDPAASATAPEA